MTPQPIRSFGNAPILKAESQRVQRHQGGCSTVDVIHAPATKPGAILFLFSPQIGQAALYARVTARVTKPGQRFEDMRGYIRAGGVQHLAEIAKG
jgi:hypothetical protein